MYRRRELIRSRVPSPLPSPDIIKVVRTYTSPIEIYIGTSGVRDMLIPRVSPTDEECDLRWYRSWGSFWSLKPLWSLWSGWPLWPLVTLQSLRSLWPGECRDSWMGKRWRAPCWLRIRLLS